MFMRHAVYVSSFFLVIWLASTLGALALFFATSALYLFALWQGVVWPEPVNDQWEQLGSDPDKGPVYGIPRKTWKNLTEREDYYQ